LVGVLKQLIAVTLELGEAILVEMVVVPEVVVVETPPGNPVVEEEQQDIPVQGLEVGCPPHIMVQPVQSAVVVAAA
jgi:hypothetical protein